MWTHQTALVHVQTQTKTFMVLCYNSSLKGFLFQVSVEKNIFGSTHVVLK